MTEPRAGVRGVDYPRPDRTTDGFLTLDGLLLAVARAIGQDPDPDSPQSAVPEVLERRWRRHHPSGGPMIRWRYRVVYKGGDGAMAIYWTNSKRDAESKARALSGQVQGPLGDDYWGAR